MTAISNNNQPAPVLKFNSGSFYPPKQKWSRPWRGEDAHFICESRNAIGVADGVGSWASKGIDSGKYARELMSNSVTALLERDNGATIRPRKALELAYSRTRSQGSSTACIIAFVARKGKDVLTYVNVGDSGFILFRKNKCLYKSPVQQHRFNCPYQLRYQLRSPNLSGGRDTPDSAYEEEIRVQDGDIVVAGTDGLFDNVYEYEIEEILSRNENGNPYKLAWKIGILALSNSMDRNYFSPFAKAAKMEGIIKHSKGGKYDDITVVVVKISSSSQESKMITSIVASIKNTNMSKKIKMLTMIFFFSVSVLYLINNFIS